MKKVGKLITALILAFSALVTSVSAEDMQQFSIAYEAASKEFVGEINAADGINAENIKIDVYTSKLLKTSKEYDKFKNTYSFSVYTDENGRFSFNKPSDNCVISIDLSTLPKKTGISAETLNISSDITSDSLTLDYIKTVSVTTNDIENDDTLVTFRSADGTVLYADYKIIVYDYNERELLKTVEGITGLTQLTAKIKVKVNGVSSTKNYKFTLPKSLKVKVQYLKVNGIISQKLATAVNDTIPSAQSLTLPEHANPIYYHVDGDSFQLCYNSGDYSQATLDNIAETMRGAYKLFVTDYGFLAPLKRSEDEYFTIFLAPSAVGSTATTKHVENGEAYIVANIPLDYVVADIDYTQSLAHELFHAITYRYTKGIGIYPGSWFNEAFASWAGLAYVGRAGQWTTDYVNIYLAELAMSYHGTSKYQCYGALLLPLTMEKSFGGFKTIKQVFIEISKLKGEENFEYTALNNALKSVNKSYSLSKAFVRCMMNNMFSSRYYRSVYGSAYWNSAKRTASYDNECVLSEYIINPMSCTYFDFTPNNSSKYLYVIISEANGNYKGLTLGCGKQLKNGKYGYFTGGVSAFYTYRFNNFSTDAAAKFTLGIINTDYNDTRTVDVTVQYQN